MSQVKIHIPEHLSLPGCFGPNARWNVHDTPCQSVVVGMFSRVLARATYVFISSPRAIMNRNTHSNTAPGCIPKPSETEHCLGWPVCDVRTKPRSTGATRCRGCGPVVLVIVVHN